MSVSIGELLYQAYAARHDWQPTPWHQLHPHERDCWIAVANRAHEIIAAAVAVRG